MSSKQPKFLTSSEALKEVLMDSDSDDPVSDSDNDPVLDDSYNDPNYIGPRHSRSRSTSVSEHSDEEQVQPLPPLHKSRSRSKYPRLRGRGRATPPGPSRPRPNPADNNDENGWKETQNRYGEIEKESLPIFDKISGLLENFVPNGPTDVMCYFNAFMCEEIFEMIATETNRYAEQVRTAKPTYSHLSSWTPATVQDIKTMLALMLTMGLINKPNIQAYWSTNPILETPFFQKTMPRNRFLALLAFMHLVNNDNQPARADPNRDKLFKIRPLVDHLNTRFASVYYPEQQLAVDESMMPFRGRVEFRLYLPSKPIRYGMKLYLCCESSSGYVLHMKFYTGANTTGPERGHGEQVVRDVTEAYMGVGHTIYMDSFFSTPGLYEHLLQQNTTACGTVNRNRKGLPKDICSKTKKLKRGEVAVRQRNGVLAARYKDNKDLMLLSTSHTCQPINTRKRKRGTDEAIIKPEIVLEYNKFMKGVDQVDQYLAFYSFNRKTVKWWKRAATHLLHLARVQAHIIYRKNTTAINKLCLLDFSLHLISGLLAQVGEEKRRLQPHPLEIHRLSHKNNPHFLVSIPATEKKKYPTKRCVACCIPGKKRGEYARRRETRYMCKSCEVALCIEPCNEIYHTSEDYAREIRRHFQV